MMPELREFAPADPNAVHARGGDGQAPLHFAFTVEAAEFLLSNGADINARDVDHESTPAQHMLRVEHKRHYPRNRQEVARYLVSRGYRTDILMAAARRSGSGTPAPGERSSMHPHERIGEVVSEAGSARGGYDLQLGSRCAPDRTRGGTRFRSRGYFPISDGKNSGRPGAFTRVRTGRRSDVSRISIDARGRGKDADGDGPAQAAERGSE